VRRLLQTEYAKEQGVFRKDDRLSVVGWSVECPELLGPGTGAILFSLQKHNAE